MIISGTTKVEVERKWIEELFLIAEKTEGSKSALDGTFDPVKTAVLIGFAKSAKYLL